MTAGQAAASSAAVFVVEQPSASECCVAGHIIYNDHTHTHKQASETG